MDAAPKPIPHFLRCRMCGQLRPIDRLYYVTVDMAACKGYCEWLLKARTGQEMTERVKT